MKAVKKYKNILELIISFILAFTIIIVFFREKQNFENLALGATTKTYFAEVGNAPIQTLGFRNKDLIIKGVHDRAKDKLVLMLGNSQSHSINQLKKGDVTFTALLADSLNKRSIDVLCSSVPNATLEDYYLLYQGWKKDLKINVLLLPVFLDDTREEGIQDVFYKDLGDFRVKRIDSVAGIVNEQLDKMNKAGVSFPGLRQTFQDKTENRIDSYLDSNFIPWHLRSNVRGVVFNDLNKLRNTVFRINATTKRGIIKNVYSRNIRALEAILKDCQKNNISVLLYIPPLRSDYEIPYVRSEYDSFKEEMQSLCKKYNAEYLNLENCVPNKYWGFKGTRTFSGRLDIDFMHFQYAGHIRVADMLQPEIEKILKK